MKIIFLDFDGVINNWNCFNDIDINNVMYLKEIVNLTGALIVATSSKKYSFQRNNGVNYTETGFFKYVSFLKEWGIEIFDVTPYVECDREKEIAKYLDEHPEILEFVIMDDDYIMNKYLDHQVFLDLYNGICEEHVRPAVKILNGELGFYPKDFNFKENISERMLRINKYHLSKKK